MNKKYVIAGLLFYYLSAFAATSMQKISLTFKDAELSSVLTSLADHAKVNIILSESVKGKITINLEKVTALEALNLIMQTHHLQKQMINNTLFITSADEMMSAKEQILQLQKRLDDLAPLQTRLLPMKYANAQDVMQAIKTSGNGLLSNRGKVMVDDRTNSLVIEDLPTNLTKINQVISHLDKPVRQIAIEARVVNVDRNFNKELGAKLGLRHQGLRLSGSLVSDGDSNNQLNVNLPQTLDGALGSGQFAIAMAKMGAGIVLDTELSAMESLGKGEIISNPHLLTAELRAATIEAGEEIPYQETSGSGATSVSFKKAVLRLQVTPQITPDKQILLKLIVNQDKRSSKPEILGVPAIDTRHLETQVLVNNGDTIVLGGIFEHAKSDSKKRVPFFAELPLIGHLFQNQATGNQHTELLIFVTPTIIE